MQVENISTFYFEYSTATDILIALPDQIDIPDFSLCLRYSDVIDTDAIQAVNSINLNLTEDADTDADIQAIQRSVTINQIFEYTPNIDTLWARCLSRKIQDYEIIQTNGTECNEVFRVRKFYTQEYMCYNFHQIKSEHAQYRFKNIAFSLSYPRVFYGIVLKSNGTLSYADFSKAVIHDSRGLPVDSVALTPGFYREWDKETQRGLFSKFQAIYYLLKKFLLPPPYVSNCRDYDGDNLSNGKNCADLCVNMSTVKLFNKVPFSTLQVYPIKLKHVNTEDIANETFSEIVEEIVKNCSRACAQPDCKDSYTFSQILKEEGSEGNDTELEYMIEAPSRPSFIVTHRPLMPFADYLVYVLSCFGTWFGLSAMSLNPFSKKKNEIPKRGTLNQNRGTLNQNRGKESCVNTYNELRKEIRNDRYLLSRLIANSNSKSRNCNQEFLFRNICR